MSDAEPAGDSGDYGDTEADVEDGALNLAWQTAPWNREDEQPENDDPVVGGTTGEPNGEVRTVGTPMSLQELDTAKAADELDHELARAGYPDLLTEAEHRAIATARANPELLNTEAADVADVSQRTFYNAKKKYEYATVADPEELYADLDGTPREVAEAMLDGVDSPVVIADRVGDVSASTVGNHMTQLRPLADRLEAGAETEADPDLGAAAEPDTEAVVDALEDAEAESEADDEFEPHPLDEPADAEADGDAGLTDTDTVEVELLIDAEDADEYPAEPAWPKKDRGGPDVSDDGPLRRFVAGLRSALGEFRRVWIGGGRE